MCGGFQVSGYLIAISANAGFTDLVWGKEPLARQLSDSVSRTARMYHWFDDGRAFVGPVFTA